MKKRVWVNQLVEVEIDETKFTEEFMKSFRQHFYNFHDLDDHIGHLAQLEARGFDSDFIEGYGNRTDMGIVVEVIDQEIEED